MLRVDQIDCGARLEHYQHLGGSLDRRKERDGLLDAIIQNSKPVLCQTRHKFALAIEHAHVNFDDLGRWLEFQLAEYVRSPGRAERVQSKKESSQPRKELLEKIGDRDAY